MSAVNLHVYGISTTTYGDGLSELKGVENSVKELREALNQQTDKDNVSWDADKSNTEAVENFRRYIRDKTPKFSTSDVFLFYFCGHGFLGGRRGDSLLLGTTNTSKNNYDADIGLKCEWIVDQLKNAGIKNYILILDCCHSGVMTMGGSFEEEIGSITEKLNLGGGVCVTSTTGSAQKAVEIEINGIKYAAFTHYFAQALHNGVQNAQPYVSISDLIDETRKLIQESPHSLPHPKIQCTSAINSYDSIKIFRNPAVPEPKSGKSKLPPKQFITDKERKEIVFRPFRDSELVFALVGAFGTDLSEISTLLKEALADYSYTEVDEFSISKSILQDTDIQNHFLKKDDFYNSPECAGKGDNYKWASYLMKLGTEIRYQMGNDFLPMMAVEKIAKDRGAFAKTQGLNEPINRPRHAYIIRSLKHPEEVNFLRKVYGNGFYLFGIYEDPDQRRTNSEMAPRDMEKLMETDEREKTDNKEKDPYGQQERNAYQMADFFIDYTERERGKANIKRILELIFGNPFITPMFSEYAMFMAWCSSLRSADLSRQIGAVVCKNNEVLASGANDCPAAGGGLYWPEYDSDKKHYVDVPNGRDYMRGHDTNKTEFIEIVKDLFSAFDIEENAENFRKIKNSKLGNLTEYGRVVHAEMEAIAACARNHISCRDAELYVTTFPCHNCAKHIIAAGFHRVVYIEAYPKSKTLEFYQEAVTTDEGKDEQSQKSRKMGEHKTKKVIFSPFFGVGPRRFIDMFAMSANFLPDKVRKQPIDKNSEGFPDNYGAKANWDPKNPESVNLRSQMPHRTYMGLEIDYAEICRKLRDKHYDHCRIPWKMDQEDPDTSQS